MAAGAGGALEVPALGYLVIGLLALCMALTLRGVRAMWVYSFGALFEAIYTGLSFSVLSYNIHLGGWARSLDHSVQNAILNAAKAFDGYAGYFFHGTAVLAEWGVREMEHLAVETLGWARWLQHVHLPGYVKWAVRALVPPWFIYKLAQAAIRAELPRIEKLAHAAVHDVTTVITQRVEIPYAGEWRWIHRHWKGLTAAVAAAGAIAIPIPHVTPGVGNIWRGFTRRLARIERRLARLEGLLGVAGMAAVMANVLGLRSWRCLTKGPIGKVSRALCGLGTQALEDLLSLLIDALVLTDICKIESLLVDAIPVVQPTFDAIIGGLDAALCHGDYHPPPLMPAQALYLPANPALELSLT